MDFTKEYVLMCEKAEEIQNLWDKKEGFVFIKSGSYWIGEPVDAGQEWMTSEIATVIEEQPLTKFCEYIWLPRQDQLQEMVTVKKGDLQSMFMFAFEGKNILEIMYSRGFDIDAHIGSVEQIMLCVVMKNKFNKVWNGEEWT
jgi:hypothetical protein